MKYSGDAILKGSLRVQSDKPLDDRTVVDLVNDLYSIDNPYEGMVVSCMADNGLYMLIDYSNRTTSQGWTKIGSNSGGGSGQNQYITQADLEAALANYHPSINHVILTQEEYDALEIKDNNTIYIIVGTSNTEESWVFGDNFPIVFS